MTTYSPGTIVLLDFPYTDGTEGKPRPALVVFDNGDNDVLVARVTTQPQQSSHEVSIVEWTAAGLRLPSIVRTHKLATMHKAKIRHTIGKLETQDYKAIGTALKSVLAGW